MNRKQREELKSPKKRFISSLAQHTEDELLRLPLEGKPLSVLILFTVGSGLAPLRGPISLQFCLLFLEGQRRGVTSNP